MDGALYGGPHYALGPRVPVLVNRDVVDSDAATAVLEARVPSRIWSRSAAATTSADRCASGEETNANLCEKSGADSNYTLPITLGIVIPVVAIIVTLLYLHRRHNKKMSREDAIDPHKSLDFGLDDAISGRGGKSKNMAGGREKDHARFKQMSMDMNLSSPYLLPPGMQGSRESLQSLAKTIHQHEDPYRPVAQFVGGDGASIRSVSRGPPDSLYRVGTNEKDMPRSPLAATGPGSYRAPPRQNSLPKPPAPEQAHMRGQPETPEFSMPTPPSPPKDPFRSPSELSRPSVESAQFPDEKDFVAMPAGPLVQEPAPTAQRNFARPMPENRPVRSDSESSHGVVHHDYTEDRHRSHQAIIHDGGPSVAEPEIRSPSQQPAALHVSPPTIDASPASPQAAVPSVAGPILAEPQEFYDFDDYAQMPQGNYNQQGPLDDEDRGRGRSQYRESVTSVYDQEPLAQTGLGIPQQDSRRLSVGFRPLPPDELMETEDPETRANRIRSFYKEYFEDSGPRPDMPEIPAGLKQQQQQRQQQQGKQAPGSVNYHEDYDQNYRGPGADEPYYDPASNSFVMPYAQPVARRAMTPPPSGSRFAGPRGPGGPGGPPPRFQGGPRGPGSRPGSGGSSQFGPPRPGSAMSQGTWGNRPRAGSSMSALGGGRNGGPRKPLPPPAALNTLPTPAKLKDDSFALFNSLEFAPPEAFKDRVAGRSQSPMGERRPYQLNVPAHSPLVNAYEELPTLPSPHLLRKSNTFTALDFAPPRKFAESDNRSDAGSIRSNRSGISAVQQQAIRGGAGRVSRLPGDTIFTQADVASKLKPQWTMRP